MSGRRGEEKGQTYWAKRRKGRGMKDQEEGREWDIWTVRGDHSDDIAVDAMIT